MSVDDISNWSVEFGPIDAEIEFHPRDIKLLANAMLSDSAAILGVNESGIWIRSNVYRQATHAHCPADAVPEFECSTAGAVAVHPSHLTTLRFATLATDPEHVVVSLDDDRITMEANEYGGTVPTVVPDREDGQHQRLADFDLSTIHDRHTAEARVVDWKFEDFLDLKADSPDSLLTLTPDRVDIMSSFGDAHWHWKDSSGSGEATYRGQELLEVFDQLYPFETTPRFAWSDDETVAMRVRCDGWLAIGYVAPSRDSTPNNSRDESDTTPRCCPNCDSQLERDPSTGNWKCQSPKCGFRSITLE
ncbi:transposase [Natrinema sp. SYSU A 869]|uniref:transposase n=1 Tax=Natrinema sp. SYSU A 869 TaxID=2871694 RepID=UPI001CA46A9F|nr:transposase [Natrinema sp. SYSU A 869]